jgi:ferredoxin
MTNLRPGLPKLPGRMFKNLIDERGYPIPYFVAIVNGAHDFRVMDGRKLAICVKEDRCWLCGDKLGRRRVFVIGPMCIVNRTSGEPPSHRDCAEFAAKACPFLTKPMAKRVERNLPEAAVEIGLMLKRNPGVCALWIVDRPGYRVVDDGNGGRLFKFATPEEVTWWAEGRTATRDEIMASIDSGYPTLESVCDDAHERLLLSKMRDDAMKFVPA